MATSSSASASASASVNESTKKLMGLLKNLMNPHVTSTDLINYLEQYHLNPNTYLPDLHNEVSMPIIYYCCSNPNLDDFFIYLMQKGCDLNLPILSKNPARQIDLLFYSQTKYIPLLIQHGSHLLMIEKIELCIEKLLINGNIIKLITLYQSGAINKGQLKTILSKKDLIFRVLDHLYEKIFLLSQQIGDNEQTFEQNYQEIVKNYINTFKLFFKNGISPNQIEQGESFAQKVLNTYFFPLIKFLVDQNVDLENCQLNHYSNFDLTNRQVMQFIYNETNFKLLSELVGDKIEPKKIYVKKLRKVVVSPAPK